MAKKVELRVLAGDYNRRRRFLCRSSHCASPLLTVGEKSPRRDSKPLKDL